MTRGAADGRTGLIERWKGIDHRLMPVDELDVRILDALSGNCRMSNIEIAESLGVSEATVRRRIGILEEDGVLLGYAARINYGMIEHPVKAYASVKADPEDRARVIRSLCQHPRSIAVYTVTGEHDILSVMLFTNTAEYDEFKESFPRTEGVKKADIRLVMNPHKGEVWSGA